MSPYVEIVKVNPKKWQCVKAGKVIYTGKTRKECMGYVDSIGLLWCVTTRYKK